MHTYDPQKEQQVWQRVQGSREERRQEQRTENIQELIMQEMASAAIFARLARQMQPREAAVLQRLSSQEQAHGSCLKGIYTLTTGQKPVIRSPQPEPGTPEAVLRRCYGNLMRNLKSYEARSEEPEFGPVFARLADQEREQCRLVLELLGGLRLGNGQQRQQVTG